MSQVKAEQGGSPSEDVLEAERKASDEDIAVSEKELQAMIEQVQEEVDAEVNASIHVEEVAAVAAQRICQCFGETSSR